MREGISGMLAYYYKVCHRKLWYFDHSITMEQNNENVALGKLLDEESFKRDKKYINIDNVINIDFIRHRGVIHEVKKSRHIEDASIWQVKYYLYYLETRGVKGIKGKIDYPLLKKSVEVELENNDYKLMKEMINDINYIVSKTCPPPVEEMNICKNCAYYDLCFI